MQKIKTISIKIFGSSKKKPCILAALQKLFILILKILINTDSIDFNFISFIVEKICCKPFN
jgi:hypothetical protein